MIELSVSSRIKHYPTYLWRRADLQPDTRLLLTSGVYIDEAEWNSCALETQAIAVLALIC